MRAYSYVVPWLLFLAAVNCFPVGEEIPGETDPKLEYPGVGVELEVRSFKMQNTNPEAKNTKDENVIAAVKGSTIRPLDESKTQMVCNEFWALTAEHSGTEDTTGISSLTWEWIINGQLLKLKKTNDPSDNLVLPGVWDDIIKNLRLLNPKKGDQFKIDGVELWGKWTLKEPERYIEASIFPGVQVTTGLPMEAIQELISIGVDGEDLSGKKRGQNHVFLPLLKAKYSNMVLITKADLKDVYEPNDEITSDMLGFYSLLMSYVKLATRMTDADRDNGPKQKLNIMPRTDWKTMYNLYAKDDDKTRKTKCRPKKKKEGQTLLEIAKDLANKKGLGDIESATFKWARDPPPPRPTVPIPRSSCRNPAAALSIRDLFSKRGGVDTSASWPSKQRDQTVRELSVKTWLEQLDRDLDALSVMDKLVFDGQIGGFGDRLEAPLYPEAAVDDSGYPLFELRDLSGGGMNQIGDFLTKAETQVKQWHKDPPESPSQRRNKRALGRTCKKPNADEKCTGKQAPNAQGKCEDCPKGMKPNPKNTQCVKDDKCTGKQAPNAQGNCEDCPVGMKPNPQNTRCVKDKCTGNTAPNRSARGQCAPCPKGMKPNVGNTVCVPSGPDKEKKQGKCKKGFILDPAEGGQDEKTAEPVCTLDDQCENKALKPVTRNPTNQPTNSGYKPECARDDDPNYRCKNSKKTYHHRDAEGGQIIHSCRATRQTKRNQKKKYQKRVDIAKEQKKQTTQSKKTEKKENNRRGRNGFCFALLVGLGAWDLAEIEAMSPDEVDGMTELWPENDIDPLFLDDSMVTVAPKAANSVAGSMEIDTASRNPIGFVIKGIGKFLTGVSAGLAIAI